MFLLNAFRNRNCDCRTMECASLLAL